MNQSVLAIIIYTEQFANQPRVVITYQYWVELVVLQSVVKQEVFTNLITLETLFAFPSVLIMLTTRWPHAVRTNVKHSHRA